MNREHPPGSPLSHARLHHPAGPRILSQIPLLTGSWRVQGGNQLSPGCLIQWRQRGWPSAWSSAGPPWSSAADTPWWGIYRSIWSGRLRWLELERKKDNMDECGQPIWKCFCRQSVFLCLTWWKKALLLEKLHDQCPPLVQCSSQGGVRHLIKLHFCQDVFSVRGWERDKELSLQDTCLFMSLHAYWTYFTAPSHLMFWFLESKV